MANVEIEFTYAIPNEWYTDDFSEGKTGTYTYRGPEYITIEIDRETGEERGWCLTTPEELERPVGEDIMRMTISARDYPLVCEICNDVGREDDREFMQNRGWKTLYKAPPGYQDIEVPAEFHPRDIYDEFNVKWDFEKEEFILPIRTWSTVEGLNISKVTWDHFRMIRDKELAHTDGRVDQTMPAEIVAEWEEYKRLLREAPTALADFPPFFAGQMLPREPDPTDSEIDEQEAMSEIWLDNAHEEDM